MIKKIVKASHLHKNDLRSIKNLVDLCSIHDQHPIKLYWNIIQDRKTAAFNDFMFYIDNNLIGYLSLFTFKIDEAEISAVIHPKYRQQNFFKRLLFEAYVELNQRMIPRCFLIIPQYAKYLDHFLAAIDAHKTISEYGMTEKKQPKPQELPEITLKLATSDDVMLMAQIGSISFGSPFPRVLQRFIDNAKDENRKAWLAQANNKTIGKIHIRYEANKTILIHDLCIIPEERGKHYAISMLLKTLELLHAEGYKRITLDVEAANRGALRLYEQCGFVVTSIFDFWEVETQKLSQIYQ